jgi:hypothetical protein
MGKSSVPFPFGVKISRSLSPFAVLDKSFLDGVNSTQLRYYAEKGWTFGLTEALMHDHLRKRDKYRIANLFKLLCSAKTIRSGLKPALFLGILRRPPLTREGRLHGGRSAELAEDRV